ncbi:MAG: PAS domain S-box protein [Anaerolineae bacterium]|nr:PAS domain S-box protein [Anaerolineae bacterium]
MESANLFQQMADFAPMMIWVSGTDKLCNHFNRPWLEFTGRTLAQEVGNGWTEGVHPDDLADCVETYLRSFDVRESFSMEYRLRRFDGQYRIILDNGSPWYDAEGNFSGYIGSCIDITAHKEVEEKLRANEEQYRVFFQDNPTLYFTLDADSRISSVNQFGAEELGYTPEELKNRPIKEIIYPDDHAAMSEQIGICLQHPSQVFQWRFRKVRKDGTVLWVEEYARTVKRQDGTLNILIVCHDITVRKQAEEALLEHERSLQHILDALPAAVWTTDSERRVTYVNAWALRFVGKTLEEQLGHGWMLDVHPDDLVYVMYVYNSAFDTHLPYTIQYRLRRFDGEFRTILENAAPRYNPAGDFLGYIGHYSDITDWQLNEEIRQEIEQRLLKILETAAEAVVSIDANQRIFQFNQSAERLFGYAPSEVIGQPVDILFPKDDHDAYTQHLADFVTSPDQTRRMIGRGEFSGRRKDGSEFPVEVSLSKSVYRRTTTITAMMLDITERLQAESLLRRQNAYLTALHDTALGLFNRQDEAVLLEKIIRRAGELIGTPNGFIDMVLTEADCLEMQVGTGIYKRFLGYRRPMGEGMNGQIWLTRKPLIINDYDKWAGRSERFTGQGFSAAMGVPLLLNDQVLGIIGLGYTEPGHTFNQEQLDVLQRFAELASIALDNARMYAQIRHHAEDLEQRVAERTLELNIQRRQLETILENAADAIVFTDLRGVILYVNPAWERLTGYTSAEALGRNPRILQSGETTKGIYNELWGNILSGKVWRGVVRNKRKDNVLYDAELTVVPVRGERDSVQYFVGVQRDVTESLKLQAQKERFVANAAHELRNPLTNFTMRLYLARKEPENLNLHLDVLDQVARHMGRLVTDLLDLSRFEHGIIPYNPEKMNLVVMIAQVIEMMHPQAQAKQIRLTHSLPDQPVSLMADPVRIQQVLTNLLTNAIHYTPEGGRVEMIVQLVEDGQHQQWVTIHVQDDGVGIASEHLPFIFQPFYRVNEQKVGTGLGLSIAKEIIEWHGGQMTVTSSLGQGSCFTVRLPLFRRELISSSAALNGSKS